MTTAHDRPTLDEPRVWIGCLECYNSGRLIGDWYSCAEAPDITTSQLHGRPIREHTHEELWCLDTDNIPVDREMSPMEAGEWGEVYDALDSPDLWPALCAWVRSGSYAAQGDTDLPVVSDFVEAFAGTWPSFTAYVEDLVEETGMLDGVPDELRGYFAIDRYARDLQGDYTVERAPAGEVYVFRSF